VSLRGVIIVACDGSRGRRCQEQGQGPRPRGPPPVMILRLGFHDADI
jgi:hypothetical protein